MSASAHLRPGRRRRAAAPRLARLVAALGLATALLAGCGSSDSDDGEGGGPAAEESADAGTRLVKDATGTEIEVPADPRRIVTLTQEDLDAVLALGLEPVGITNGQGLSEPPAYLADRVADVTVVGDLLQPVLDKVVEARPDLILAGDMQDTQLIGQLRQITPATLVTMAPSDDWKLFFRGVGNAVNRLDEANAVIAEHEAEAAEAGAALGANAGAEVSIVRWNPDGPSWMENQQFASGIALEMGLTRPAAQDQDGNAHTPSLSLERLSEIDGDWIFVSTLTEDGAAALEEIQGDPAYQRLAAVRADHVVTVNGSVWSTRGGPLAADVVVEDITEALADAS